jgi:toxin HigB-1
MFLAEGTGTRMDTDIHGWGWTIGEVQDTSLPDVSRHDTYLSSATRLIMIHNFKTKDAEAVWNGKTPKGFPSDLVRPAQRKLAMLAAAIDLIALRQPPGNRLEALKGNREGQHSIRINDQWRICFVWRDSAVHDVEIVDYH